MNFQSNKPLYVTFDVPTTMTLDDKIKVDLRIGNLNSYSLNVRITSTPATDGGISYTIPAGTFSVRPRTSISKQITLTANQVTTGQTFIKVGVSARSNGINFDDALTLPIRVLPKGFPRSQSSGGMIGSNAFSNDTKSSASFPFTIPSSIQDNSAIFKFQLYSSNFAQLTSAISSLIQEPSGCFEQTSSTLYPMVMGMQYLQALPADQQATPKVQGMMVDIQGKLKKGYDKLVSFQTKEKGYEWFGESPAHEGLSAYGLMEFTEMS